MNYYVGITFGEISYLHTWLAYNSFSLTFCFVILMVSVFPQVWNVEIWNVGGQQSLPPSLPPHWLARPRPRLPKVGPAPSVCSMTNVSPLVATGWSHQTSVTYPHLRMLNWILSVSLIHYDILSSFSSPVYPVQRAHYRFFSQARQGRTDDS